MGWTYSEWYKKHGEEVRARRRQRYHKNGAYRERQQDRSREYQRKRRKDSAPVLFGRLSIKRPFSVQLSNGTKFTCWSVGVLDHLLGERKGYVADREKRGMIPPTPIRDRRSRYYTTEMIDVVVQGADAVGAGGWTGDFFRTVRTQWEMIPFWVALEAGHFKKVPFSTFFPLVFGGPRVEFFGTKYLAVEVGRTEEQVLAWEDRGVIPYTPFRLERERLYSKEMVESIRAAVQARGALRVLDKTLPGEIQEVWDRHLAELKDDA